jgi:hypothetical protein
LQQVGFAPRLGAAPTLDLDDRIHFLLPGTGLCR